jgi:hypothetical protein
MIYQPGDYVYPADLPRPLLCRVRGAERLGLRKGTSQVLRLEPLEGPWPAGTTLVRLDEYVLPARPRQLWQGSMRGWSEPPAPGQQDSAEARPPQEAA